MLRNNQLNAINITINNDFESGIHFHATGTGKSWIALKIILEYNLKYPRKSVLWICEQKSILVEQFNKETIKERGFGNIFKHFLILNYSSRKQTDWYNSVNVSKMWGKPALIIINRAFLVSNDKYTKLKSDIGLIIHDECHSIINKTSQKFYQYIMNTYQNIKCIGFSATPNLSIKPYNKIISKYSIYDSFCDQAIVGPKIYWCNSNKFIDYSEIAIICQKLLDDLYYKKIIVWCGTIDLCNQMAKLYQQVFPEFMISIDTSIHDNNSQINNYNDFEKRESHAFLFCACKHREGSDITNLDGCIFLDKVQNRNSKTFIQCIGRVLRKDKLNNKKYGLILDVKAKSSISICDRMNEYLNISNHFPWKYNYEYCKINHKNIKLNCLELIDSTSELQLQSPNNISSHNVQYSIEDIQSKFIRNFDSFDNFSEYSDRLNRELRIIYHKNLIEYLIRAVDILELTDNIPHVTRGSCGSSLVCYLLGISHVDPIKYNIKFARFMNEYRSGLPDIDFDFPHFLRDDVFLKLQLKWPGRVARISNHVYYHKKSAQREAIRRAGINKFISKYDIKREIKKLPYKTQLFICTETKKLENTFRCYSLHCGGIIFYPDQVPDKLKLKGKTDILSQVVLNKHDVSEDKTFKIDILSSRALSQLYYANNYKNINFEKRVTDKRIIDLFASGNNVGLTLAESPLIRKVLMTIKPKNIEELAICLAIIRPAAKKARDSTDYENSFIFDDDAIEIIEQLMNCDEDTAEMYRKGYIKKDTKIMNTLKNKIKFNSSELFQKLKDLRRYSFCKSHAYSYAQLVWQLAYMKIKKPKKFWEATLFNCHSSYRKWVHYFEAHCAGVDIFENELNKDKSIYSLSRQKKISSFDLYQQMRKYGYWIMKDQQFFPGCYFIKRKRKHYFNGIIASSRMISYGKNKKAVLFIGIDKGHYIELNISGDNIFLTNKIGIQGKCKLINEETLTYHAYEYVLY